MSHKSRLVGAVLGGSLLFGASLASADVTITYPGTGCVQQMRQWSMVSLWYQGTEAQHINSGPIQIGCPVPQVAGRVESATITGHNYDTVNGVSCWLQSRDRWNDSGFSTGTVNQRTFPHYTITLPGTASIHGDGATYLACIIPTVMGAGSLASSIATYVVVEDSP
jgi:hypothetical protein